MYPSTPIPPLLSEAGLVPDKTLLDFRRKSYAYQLLTLPDHHPTKHILPVSLRMGDESSQPGEQPEDILMWVENANPRLFEHLLAQQIASNHSIDPADGIEPVDSLAPNSNFGGKVIIEGKRKKWRRQKDTGQEL